MIKYYFVIRKTIVLNKNLFNYHSIFKSLEVIEIMRNNVYLALLIL